MVIAKSKQNWEIGNLIKVGFLTLKVLNIEAGKNGLPDYYILENPKNGGLYRFIPWYGLEAFS